MIHKSRTHLHFANRKRHFAQFLDFNLSGQLTHGDREEWRLHRLGEDLRERGARFVETEDTDLVFWIVSGSKKRETLNVVPMGVCNQERKLDWFCTEFLCQLDSQRPDARACIEYDDLVIHSHLDASGVAAVAQRGTAGHSYGTTRSPKLDSHGRC